MTNRFDEVDSNHKLWKPTFKTSEDHIIRLLYEISESLAKICDCLMEFVQNDSERIAIGRTKQYDK